MKFGIPFNSGLILYCVVCKIFIYFQKLLSIFKAFCPDLNNPHTGRRQRILKWLGYGQKVRVILVLFEAHVTWLGTTHPPIRERSGPSLKLITHTHTHTHTNIVRKLRMGGAVPPHHRIGLPSSWRVQGKIHVTFTYSILPDMRHNGRSTIP